MARVAKLVLLNTFVRNSGTLFWMKLLLNRLFT